MENLPVRRIGESAIVIPRWISDQLYRDELPTGDTERNFRSAIVRWLPIGDTEMNFRSANRRYRDELLIGDTELELRIGESEMNWTDSVREITEQRVDRQKKGERARWRCEAAKRKREKKRVCRCEAEKEWLWTWKRELYFNRYQRKRQIK